MTDTGLEAGLELEHLADTADPWTDYLVRLSCLRCGGPVTHTADGRLSAYGRRAVAVAQCADRECNRSYLLTVTFDLVTPPHRNQQ